jgi:hypothetical protein
LLHKNLKFRYTHIFLAIVLTGLLVLSGPLVELKPVFADVLPTVITQPASDIKHNEALLNGTIIDLGDSDCDYVGAGYGPTSVPANPGNVDPLESDYHWKGFYYNYISSAPADFTYDTQTYLSAGTIYYYRIAAHNSTGWAWGNELTFLTCPESPSDMSCTVIDGGTGANLAWTKGTGAQKTRVLRKAGDWPASYDDATATEVYFDTGTSCSDAGLDPGTIYYYRAWSYTTIDIHEQWSIGYAQVATIDPPTVITHPPVWINPTRVRLHGEIVYTGGQTCTHIRYSIIGVAILTLTQSAGVGDYYYTEATSINPATKYTWKFGAQNSAGWGSGEEVSFLTPPNPPTDLTATPVSDTQINLTWNKDAKPFIKVMRKTGDYPVDYNDGTEVYYGKDTSCSDIDLVPNTTYYYRAWTYYSVDEGALEQWAGPDETQGTTLPGPPTVAIDNVTDIDQTGATLHGILTNDGGAGCQYRFQYGTTSGTYTVQTPWTDNITSGNNFSAAIAGLTPSTQYFYIAQCRNVAGEGNSEEGNFTTAAEQNRVVTATGKGVATFFTSNGVINRLAALAQSQLACSQAGAYSFPFGFFSFTISEVAVGGIATITINLPSNIPAGTEYWKCINGQWVDCTSLLGDDDGDNVLTLTITDGGPGDADGIANGIIVDPGGPAQLSGFVASSLLDSSSGIPELIINRPANLSVKYVSVQPQQVSLNEPVTIYANITNSGDITGNYNITLKINDTVEETETGSIGAHAAKPLKFEVIKEQPGTYTVDINGQQVYFTVVDENSNANAGKVIPIIFLLVCVCGIIFVSTLLVKRARSGQ